MRMRIIAAVGIIAAVLSVAGLGAQPRAAIDVARLGPQVGERVPDFALRDQSGAARTLQSVMGARGLMLVFIRSADW
jgi:cytochrome oxidase Cu insertion factor (SCO1/SenC/PrrC family)